MLFSNRTIIILLAISCTALAAALPDPNSSQTDLTRRSYARLAYRSPGDTTQPPKLITPPVHDVRAIAILRL